MLALAEFAVMEEGSAARRFAGWSYSHDTGLDKRLSEGEICRLYEEIGSDLDGINTFRTLFLKACRISFPHIKTLTVFSDEAGPYTQGSDNFRGMEEQDSRADRTASGGDLQDDQGFSGREDLPPSGEGFMSGKPGKNGWKESLPEVHAAFFVDEETGITLDYGIYVGSLLSQVNLPGLCRLAQRPGFENFFLFLDAESADRGFGRGDFLEKDSKALLSPRFGARFSEGSEFFRDLLRHGEEIKDCQDDRMASLGLCGVCEMTGEDEGLDGYLYYDGARGEEERKALHAKTDLMLSMVTSRKHLTKEMEEAVYPWLIIEKTEDKADNEGREDKANKAGKDIKGKEIRDQEGKRFDEDYTASVNDKGFAASVNHQEIQKQLDHCGYFAILSDSRYPAERMGKAVRRQDEGEKKLGKLEICFEPEKLHSRAGIEGKIFMVYLSMILWDSFCLAVKDALKRAGMDTYEEALDVLERYAIGGRYDGTWAPCCELTREAGELFASLGLSPEEVRLKAQAVTLNLALPGR